jgi:hypothetical protein
VQDAFGTLVWIVAAVGAIVAVLTLAGTGKSYREIGARAFQRDDGRDPLPSDAQRDDEIRQLLRARNARRARRGEAQQDVEAELRALTSPPAADGELREEIRRHVLARNARRARTGSEPLDVDSEIARRLRELT